MGCAAVLFDIHSEAVGAVDYASVIRGRGSTDATVAWLRSDISILQSCMWPNSMLDRPKIGRVSGKI